MLLRRGAVGSRGGLATLEMALVLPLLALVMAVFFLIGRSGLARLHTTLEARQKAWRQRHGASPTGSLAIRPSPQDLVRGEAEQAVKGPTVAGIAPPTARSRHAVLGGALDFHDIPLDHPPELDFARTMAGTEGGAFDLSGLTATLASKLGPMDALQAQGQQQFDAANQQLQQKRQKLQAQLQQVQAQLKQARQQVQALSQTVGEINGQVADLQKQRNQALQIKDKAKRKAALAAIDQQLKLLRSQQSSEQQQLDAALKKLHTLQAEEAVGKFSP